MNAKEFLNVALGGNMNFGTLKPMAIEEIMEQYARQQSQETCGADVTLNNLLAAPCLLCGYNGINYWQVGTHKENCPWHGVAGKEERAEKMPKMIRFAVQNTYGC